MSFTQRGWRPLLLAVALAGLNTGVVLAVQRGDYALEVLVDGRPLTEVAAHGVTYVEALRGREYAIRLTNRSGERIAIALAVDGLNTIDARTTTARAASKWILGPYETVTLDGWQTGEDAARRFFFTTEPRSYGAWLGRTENLGLIAAAVYRERAPGPQRWASAPAPERRSERPPAASGANRSGAAKEAFGTQDSTACAPDLAATGIGRRVDHPVERVAFRAQSRPAAVLELRYEFRDALVRLGVRPPDPWRRQDLERRERARGFLDSGFCPDPFAGRRD